MSKLLQCDVHLWCLHCQVLSSKFAQLLFLHLIVSIGCVKRGEGLQSKPIEINQPPLAGRRDWWPHSSRWHKRSNFRGAFEKLLDSCWCHHLGSFPMNMNNCCAKDDCGKFFLLTAGFDFPVVISNQWTNFSESPLNRFLLTPRSSTPGPRLPGKLLCIRT